MKFCNVTVMILNVAVLCMRIDCVGNIRVWNVVERLIVHLVFICEICGEQKRLTVLWVIILKDYFWLITFRHDGHGRKYIEFISLIQHHSIIKFIHMKECLCACLSIKNVNVGHHLYKDWSWRNNHFVFAFKDGLISIFICTS